ncbi:AMP-binding protein [Kitasatospora sp. NPDC058115]|uniref:AMP-binding protein n=1 Tax=Kitasatospora sp. NPDC058115 TaxID=3346347 RepID=UPI0036DDD4B6
MTATLLQLLESRGGSSTLTLVEEDRRVLLADLLAESRVTAAGLASLGIAPGDRVAFVMHNGSGFLRLLFGAQYLGAVPLSIALPFGYGGVDGYVQHVAGILADSGAGVLVVDPELKRVRGALERAIPGVTVLSADALPAGDAGRVPAAPADPEQLAYIQYTSGSTASPKGVPVTHGNIVTAVHALASASGSTGDDTWGLWVPLFHDMGIFCLLTALGTGCDAVLWRPRGGVKRPLDWLRRFAAEGCTHTAAPNFFVDALVSAVRAEEPQPEPADLSAWRVWCNGAEQVNARSIEEFQKTFGSWGFRPQTMCPVYGMAEATLTVTFSSAELEPRLRWVDREALADGRFALSTEGAPNARALVSVGTPVPDIAVRVCADGAPVPEGHPGEIEISGPSVMSGYYRRPAGDERSPDGWHRTGDMGVIADGELYIFGRRKDMIIVRGVNYYAEDAEAVVRDLPGVARKACAAIAAEDHMALVVETALTGEDERAALIAACHRQLRARMGLSAVTVHLAPTRFLPQTSSGKVQRGKLRSLLDELGDGRGAADPAGAA